ncbi:hypothetical protein [Halorarius litoreus]|uniref:hypothetical protein n=1 Tax=Halorarius litoreus TaxID=2962676 RepID=UPI0020CC716B|nr:hypothetical protein [Halorarius litoreus]
MTESDPLAAFDDDLIAAVARDRDIGVARLSAALCRQQEHARSLPGVDGLVYEWRRFLPYDPLVHRGETAYYLVFLPSVWAEFGEQLSFDEPLLEAVKRVHDQQFSRALASLDEDDSVREGGAAMVLTR